MQIARLKSDKVKCLVFLLVYIFYFRVFSGFEIPAYFLLEVAFYILSLGVALFVLIANRVEIRLKLLFLFLFLLFGVCLSVVNAWLVFGQPLYIGVLANRSSIYTIVISFVIVSFLWQFKVDDRQKIIESGMVFVAWFFLLLWTFLSLVLNPLNFIDTAVVDYRHTSEVYRFRFEELPIVFGFLYYFTKAYYLKRICYLFYSLMFILYLIFVFQGRVSLMLSLVVVIPLFVRFLLEKGVMKYLVYLVLPVLIIPMSVGISSYVVNGGFDQLFYLVSGQFMYLTDSSAVARLVEFENIENDLNRYLFSGVGFVSSQFKNGYEGFYDYYFPTDIGVIGMVHIYGLVYVVMFLLVVLYYYFQVKMRSDNYLHHALGLYFMYLLIISIQNGVGFMFSGAFMILIYFKSLLRGNDG
jgi:hypothetical protein